MSILSSLTRAYDRLPDAPPFGLSEEKIGFLISLNADGSVAHVIPLRDTNKRKPQPRAMLVPLPPASRTGTSFVPDFLWGKTDYVLGVTAKSDKNLKSKHEAFLKHHLKILDGTDDAGLSALAAFLREWVPKRFVAPDWPKEMKGKNVVFALESERLSNLHGLICLHDRPAAREIWKRVVRQRESVDGGRNMPCLATANTVPAIRLHPAVKDVRGTKDSSAKLISFNKDAFKSYGHIKGENAPVSVDAAFKYTAVLNHFLRKDSGHRIQIGDASTVFWADASDKKAASMAENMFAGFMNPTEEKAPDSVNEEERIDEEDQLAKEIAIRLQRIRNGERLKEIDENLAREDIRFFVLGLAPNVKRLSVRFYFEDSFGALTENYQRFLEDMKIKPPPRDGSLPFGFDRLEMELKGEKEENIPRKLSGEWIRAILSGENYPLTLLYRTLARIRADSKINDLRAGILKALLRRNFEKEVPVALNQEFDDKGYLLGRLFAVYKKAQEGALGNKVNSTIKDRFYGSAMSSPSQVFGLLERDSSHHLSKIGKERPGHKVNLEKLIAGIMGRMAPEDDPFPAWLSPAEQAFFALGYHHQRAEFFNKTTDGKETDQ